MGNNHEHEAHIEQNHKLLNKNFMVVAFIIAIVMAFIILISIGMNNDIHLYNEKQIEQIQQTL